MSTHAVSDLTCGRCHRNAPAVNINGIWADPTGWSHVTVTGLPVVNRLTCPPCSDDVKALLNTAPDVARAQREAENTAAFRRGYEDGCDDVTRASTQAIKQEVPACRT